MQKRTRGTPKKTHLNGSTRRREMGKSGNSRSTSKRRRGRNPQRKKKRKKRKKKQRSRRKERDFGTAGKGGRRRAHF